MPLFKDADMDSRKIAGSDYGFSARRIEDLGASEYTLSLIIADASGSVSAFRQELEDCIKQIAASCRRHPRADNMMLRVLAFNDELKEIHGFRPLSEINENDYSGCIRPGGLTALYDAAVNGVRSATEYGRALTERDFDVNAAVFVITDGGDNRSSATRKMVAEALAEAVASEALESIFSVLIGVNAGDGSLDDYLRELKEQAGFSHYLSIGGATAKELSRLGGFVSRSISNQSQALGSGAAGGSLSF